MPIGEKKTIERNQHWFTLGTGIPSTNVQSNPFTLWSQLELGERKNNDDNDNNKSPAVSYFRC
jgi:hypothetical protein